MIQLIANSISKNFYNFKIFKDINFNIISGQSLAITGRNGSGKTTLIRILSHLIQPSNGTLTLSQDSKIIHKEDFYKYWNLNNNPQESELWGELEKIIDLGGTFESK